MGTDAFVKGGLIRAVINTMSTSDPSKFTAGKPALMTSVAHEAGTPAAEQQ